MDQVFNRLQLLLVHNFIANVWLAAFAHGFIHGQLNEGANKGSTGVEGGEWLCLGTSALLV